MDWDRRKIAGVGEPHSTAAVGLVTAHWSMAFNGSTPIGAPIIGALSDTAGPRYALALGAAACLGAVFVGRAGTHGPNPATVQ